MNSFSYFMPTRVVFGAGVVNELGETVRALGARPLLVTGKSALQAAGWEDPIRSAIDPVGHARVDADPTYAACDTMVAAQRDARPDVIVAVGGGSAIDAAKAVAGGLTNDGPLRSYAGRDRYAQAPLPLVAVPTTSGTGSEVTPSAVLVDSDAAMKATLAGAALFPRVALLDPALTVSMPRDVTVATGLDVLSQGMEGFVSKNSTPMGDLLALETCRLVRENLPRVVAAPDDREARGQMLYAAMLSGCAIAQSGTTLVHGLGYYYTLRSGIAHGLANALLLRPLFRWNAAFLPERVAALDRALGGDGAAIDSTLLGFFEAIGVSAAAKDYGVAEEALRDWAAAVHADPYRFKNQAGEFTVDDVHQLLDASWAGR